MKKTIQSVLAILFTFAALLPAQAQQPTPDKPKPPSPEKRAQKQTADMAAKLALTEDQTAQVRDINLKYAQQMQELRNASTAPDADKKALHDQKKALRDAHEAELKGVFTPEQWEKWSAARSEKKGRHDKPDKGKKAKKSADEQ
jgi:Domain of unknown function (DUF4890)